MRPRKPEELRKRVMCVAMTPRTRDVLSAVAGMANMSLSAVLERDIVEKYGNSPDLPRGGCGSVCLLCASFTGSGGCPPTEEGGVTHTDHRNTRG